MRSCAPPRRVCELYSEALGPARIAARYAELRLGCHHDPERPDVLVTVHTEHFEGFEYAAVTLPAGIAALPARARAELVLDVIHGAALRMGQARGWDLTALHDARGHALAAGLRYRWEGPAKASPDRRHSAQPVYDLLDDGYGRVVVQVRRRADGHLVAESAPALAFSTSAGFARSARTLRWCSSTLVELVPFCGLSAGTRDHVIWADVQGLVTINLDDDQITPTTQRGEQIGEHQEQPSLTAAVTPPKVIVRGEGRGAPEAGSRIVILGGGPTDGVPPAYCKALDALLQQMAGAQWLAWWSAARYRVLEISCDFAAITPTIDARRSKGTLRIDIPAPRSDPVRRGRPSGAGAS
jgi:hypothetical protein